MLNEIAYQVWNNILDNNVFEVRLGKSISTSKPTLYITTRQKIDYNDFVKKIDGIVTEDNISCVDGFSISIDLDFKAIKEMTEYAQMLCNREFQALKK